VLHHVGIAHASIDAVVTSYETSLNLRVVSGPFVDPLQGARVIFLSRQNGEEAAIELVEPTGAASPLARFVNRGGGMHHVCFVTQDLDGELARVRALGALVVQPPVPAIAFQSRRIAWIYTRDRLLVELLEERL